MTSTWHDFPAIHKPRVETLVYNNITLGSLNPESNHLEDAALINYFQETPTVPVKINLNFYKQVAPPEQKNFPATGDLGLRYVLTPLGAPCI